MEENKETIVNETEEPTAEEQSVGTEETVNVDVAELKARIAKLERAKAKSDSEAADWKKKYRATQSAQEVAEAEREEAKAAVEQKMKEMERELTVNRLEKSYLGMGFTSDEAGRMAEAEADVDVESKMKILAEVDARKKKDYEAEWLKSRPQPSMGNGDSDVDDLFIQGFKSVKGNF